ncbi:MAG: rod shape-determining protein MreC, partial [Candidatus Tantalella remota]|nr:rod shape-determining protein MreC [Candidatus Tantalella remota]
MEEISRENNRLRNILNFKNKLPYQTVAARIIARDSLDWRKSVIIDKGKKDGLKEHMSCVTPKGLVGSVSEINENTSKVMLISDPASRVGVMLERSRESGVLVGAGVGCD